MNYFETVGQNILHVLDKQNMKKADLAKKLNISRQMVQKIIGGQKAINVKEIASIAEALAVTVDALLYPSNLEMQADASVQFMGKPGQAKDFAFVEKTIREYMKLEDRRYESP
jgi:transcriptional regulator with XRE-family HTH domain